MLFAVALALAFVGQDRIAVTARYVAWRLPFWWASEQRLYDEANLVPSYEEEGLEEALNAVAVELDLDVRLAFVRGLEGRTLEEASLDFLEGHGIGRRTKAWRGLLFFYDADSERARIEVGYGLEEWFPDVLVSWIAHEHVRDFLAYGDAARAFTWAVPLLLLRLRQANLDGGYDPGREDTLALSRFGGSGAGAAVDAPRGHRWRSSILGELPPGTRASLAAAPTPQAALARYIDWISQPVLDPDVALLTPDSRQLVRSAPSSHVTLALELETLPGRRLAFDVRGDLALAYATGDPFTFPYFLQRGAEGWQVDLPAQWRNVQAQVGSGYAWTLRDTQDEYARAFAGRYVRIGGALRVAGGDNRRFHPGGTTPPTPRLEAPRVARRGEARTPSPPPMPPFPDGDGWTALHLAAARGDTGEVASLLAGGAPLEARNANGRTPLYEAAKRGRSDVVRLLLARGADPQDAGGRFGLTPLHTAAEYQHGDVVSLLLAAGADPGVRNPIGLTPLYQLANYGGDGAAALVPLLVGAGAPVDAPANDGWTPLRAAVRRSDVALSRALLAAHADPDAVASDGSSLLHLAAHKDDAAMIRLLVEAGARTDVRLANGATPLGQALWTGHAAAARALLEAGARPETGLPADMLATAEASGDARTVALVRDYLRLGAP